MEEEKKEQPADKTEANHGHEHEAHHAEHHAEHSTHQPHKSKSKFNSDFAIVCLILLLGLILIVNIWMTAELNGKVKESIETAKEQLRPASIALTVIEDKRCTDCFDIKPVANTVKNSKVNVTRETSIDFKSENAKSLLSKYNIKKIPAVIVTGEISKLNLEGFEKINDALVVSALNPPYIDAATGEVQGRVNVYRIEDNGCDKCFNMSQMVQQLKLAGVRVIEDKMIDISSPEGKEWISKYNIGFVPSLILSKEASVYELVTQTWTQIGTREKDGSYVLRLLNPPFINLTTNELRGLVDVTYLMDKGCTTCHNVKLHREIIASPRGLNAKLNNEKTVDISDAEGKELLSKYGITKVPTIILSKDITVYPSFAGLGRFFSLKNDGSYVFTAVESMGTYKDILKGEVVEAEEGG